MDGCVFIPKGVNFARRRGSATGSDVSHPFSAARNIVEPNTQAEFRARRAKPLEASRIFRRGGPD
jgi:hypothetical protein